MSEFVVKVVGWVEVNASDEESACVKAMQMYGDAFDNVEIQVDD